MDTITENSVSFIGLSDSKLDDDKMDHALNLFITDYNLKELEEMSISIANIFSKYITYEYSDYLMILTKTYYTYRKSIEHNLSENKNIHGNLDFYDLIRIFIIELTERKNELYEDRKNILTIVSLYSLERSFNGIIKNNIKIKKIFTELNPYYKEIKDFNSQISFFDCIQKNISDLGSRYLMVITEGSYGLETVKLLLNKINRKYKELIGSKFENDMITGKYSKEILDKIQNIIETDNILIMKDLDMIYPSLYNLFNQKIIPVYNKKYARIADEYINIGIEINQNFYIIILVDKYQIENNKLPPPFLNYFEKHILNFDTYLEERDINIAKKITNYIKLVVSLNNNQNLKKDLDKLLIICSLDNIKFLIFK